VIIVATRWHTDDLIGRVTQRMDDWEVISLPAIALENDPLGRRPGEPLFPERYDLKRLEEIRRARAGTYLWEAMYQQQPFDDAMAFTNPDWFPIIERLPMAEEARLHKARVWDLAATSAGGDWTVGGLLGKDEPSSGCYILNIKRRQLSPAEVEKLVRQTAEADGRETDVVIEQEPGSSGKALVEHYQRNVLPNFNVVPSRPQEGRALTVSGAGRTPSQANFWLQRRPNKRATPQRNLPRICHSTCHMFTLCACGKHRHALRRSPFFTFENPAKSES